MKIVNSELNDQLIKRSLEALNTKTHLFIDKDVLVDILWKIGKTLHDTRYKWTTFYGSLVPTDRDGIIKRFIELGIPAELLVKPNGSYSNDKITLQKVLDVIDDEFLIEAINVFKDRSYYTRLRSQLGQYTALNLYKEKSYEGHDMLYGRPYYDLLKTLRVSASNPSVQNMPRVIQTLYTAPKGHVLLSSDSSQIEPNIIYSNYIRDEDIMELSKLYNDIYYGVYHYVMGDKKSRVKMNIKKEERNKIKTLNNKFMYGGKPTSNDEVEHKFYHAIGEHPQRKAWEEEARKIVNARAPQIKNYFGVYFNIDDGNTKYSKLKYSNDPKKQETYKEFLVRCAINNPIQSTAAMLMHKSVVTAHDFLSSTNFGYQSLSKHDEGFYIIKEEVSEIMQNIVKDWHAYEVDGWLPIKSDLTVGRKEIGFDIDDVSSEDSE